MAPRETENNAYANFWRDKQRALWYAMVFYGVVNRSFRNRMKSCIYISVWIYKKVPTEILSAL